MSPSPPPFAGWLAAHGGQVKGKKKAMYVCNRGIGTYQETSMPIFAPVNRSSGRHMGRGREKGLSSVFVCRCFNVCPTVVYMYCIVPNVILDERTTIRCRSTGSSCLDFSLQCRIIHRMLGHGVSLKSGTTTAAAPGGSVTENVGSRSRARNHHDPSPDSPLARTNE